MKNKSNIDYKYYHLFNNLELNLDYNFNHFTINYIIYIINSDFSHFINYYNLIKHQIVSDIFIERLNLSNIDKQAFFSMKFKKLFWLRINNIHFSEEDYDGLISLLNTNSSDINRIFIENTYLTNKFFCKFLDLKGFNNITFINFDNNNLTDLGLNCIIKFLVNNNISLDYLSLINTQITDIKKLMYYLNNSKIRILDLSSNKIIDNQLLIDFIEINKTIKELYIRNIEFSDKQLEDIIKNLEKGNTNIYFLRITLNIKQKKYIEKFSYLENQLNIRIDINFLLESRNNIFSTIYIKQIDSPVGNFEKIENDYFYIIDTKNIDRDFNNIINKKNKELLDGINLFLFDFIDYYKIEYLLTNYNFNYIYLENYNITDNDFIYFINTIKKQNNKKYKINLISIELTQYQLEFLIDNFPINIIFIEINLNKIQQNREKFIIKMLKNKAFIFENIEFYKKIFDNNGE